MQIIQLPSIWAKFYQIIKLPSCQNVKLPKCWAAKLPSWCQCWMVLKQVHGLSRRLVNQTLPHTTNNPRARNYPTIARLCDTSRDKPDGRFMHA
jgi:hypothetical protein